MKDEELKMLTDEQLKNRLRTELDKKNLDGAKVRKIMRALRQRDAEGPQDVPKSAEEAWREFQETEERESEPPEGRNIRKGSRLWRVALVAAMLGVIIFAVPLALGAENIVQLVAVWTDETFRFVRPGETTAAPREYVFETDHPGLQEIYDTVTDLGVTFPVVPMWVPEGYELSEVKTSEVGEQTKVYAALYKDGSKIVFLLHIGVSDNERWQEKDAGIVEEWEIDGISHHYMSNKDELLVTWNRDNVICYISIDAEREMLRTILDSVYHKR